MAAEHELGEESLGEESQAATLATQDVRLRPPTSHRPCLTCLPRPTSLPASNKHALTRARLPTQTTPPSHQPNRQPTQPPVLN